MQKRLVSYVIFCASIAPVCFLKAQQCEVEKESIRGAYTGDCKKGKAHGQGKSVGVDSYEGSFKSGLPDGQGTYTWSNGSAYTGGFVKGLKEGKGIMTLKKEGVQDSVVEGFWKKDTYVGKYEKPWEVYSKTGSVRSVDIEYTPDNVNRIKIIITNTTGGTKTTSGFEMPRFKVDNTIILKGFYQRITSLESHLKSTETSLMEVTFPLRVKLQIAREEVEVEFLEPGSYSVNIQINQ